MKPRELYSGQAPAAMGMMGQGLLETGANIGRSIQSGYQALGQGLAAGLEKGASALAGAYTDMKKLDAESKASEKMFNTLKEGGYLDPKLSASIDAQAAAMKHASTLDRANFWKEQKALAGAALSQNYALARIGEETRGGIQKTNAAADAGVRSAVLQRAMDEGMQPPVPAVVPVTKSAPQGGQVDAALPQGGGDGNPDALMGSRFPYRSPEEMDASMPSNPFQQKLLEDYKKRRDQRAGQALRQSSFNPYQMF